MLTSKKKKGSHCAPSLVTSKVKSRRGKAKGNFFHRAARPPNLTSPFLPFSRSPFEAAFRVPNFASSLARNRGFRLRILPSPLSPAAVCELWPQLELCNFTLRLRQTRAKEEVEAASAAGESLARTGFPSFTASFLLFFAHGRRRSRSWVKKKETDRDSGRDKRGSERGSWLLLVCVRNCDGFWECGERDRCRCMVVFGGENFFTLLESCL